MTYTDAPSSPPIAHQAAATAGAAPNAAGGGRIRSHRPPTPGARATHLWARRIHVYASMIALLVVLFFGVTGLTLNHPEWTFGDATSTATVAGTFPFTTTDSDGVVQYLPIAEYVRSEYSVLGTVDDFGVTNGRGTIGFRNPGYQADVFFDTVDDSFELTVTQQGFVGVMNDLHKGRDAGPAWRWVIDVSAVFLVVISLSGLTMQFFLKKRRRPGLVAAVIGGLVTIVLAYVTLM